MVTSSRTHISSFTLTQTSTHLSDVILGSIVDILSTLKIDPTDLFTDWQTYQSAISNWIEEGSLSSVALECHQPDGSIHPIFEFPVKYTSNAIGDRHFISSRATRLLYLSKLSSVPAGTKHRLICTFRFNHSEQPGWVSANRADTAELRSYSFGTLASAPHASANLQFYTRED